MNFSTQLACSSWFCCGTGDACPEDPELLDLRRLLVICLEVVVVVRAGNICGMNWLARANKLKAGTKKLKFTDRGVPSDFDRSGAPLMSNTVKITHTHIALKKDETFLNSRVKKHLLLLAKISLTLTLTQTLIFLTFLFLVFWWSWRWKTLSNSNKDKNKINTITDIHCDDLGFLFSHKLNKSTHKWTENGLTGHCSNPNRSQNSHQ